MKNTLESALDANLRLEEETLSDGSKVFNVIIGRDTAAAYEIPCNDYQEALERFTGIMRAAGRAHQTTLRGN